MKKGLFVFFLLLFLCFCVHSIADVPIDQDHFPDEHFRQLIIDYADKDEDGILSEDEGRSVSTLYIANDLSSLKGIEYLPELFTLKCENVQITELDLSQNYKLDELDILSAENLQKVDLSQNPITTLYLMDCPSLQDLKIYPGAPLAAIHFSDCPIDNMELGAYKDLSWIEIYNIPITTLDLSQNTKLQELEYYGDSLTSLDLSHNSGITNLSIGSQSPLECDIHNLINLEQLRIDYLWQDDLLDLINQPNLNSLCICDCSITSLDISHCSKLEDISIISTKVNSLDISNNPGLKSIYLSDTNISTLDIRSCPLLMRLLSRHKMEVIDGWGSSIHRWETGNFKIQVDADTKVITE